MRRVVFKARPKASPIANVRNEEERKVASWPVSRVLSGSEPDTGMPSVGQSFRDDHSSGTHIAERLKQPTRMAGLKTDLAPRRRAPGHPYLVLLPVGFALPRPSPAARCALTAPFHPYLQRTEGGLLSVALSLGSPPAAVSRHRVSMEPGLSSTGVALRATKPAIRQRPSGQLASVNKGCGYAPVKSLSFCSNPHDACNPP